MFAKGVKEESGQENKKTVVKVEYARGVGVYLNCHSVGELRVWMNGTGNNNLRADLCLVNRRITYGVIWGTKLFLKESVSLFASVTLTSWGTLPVLQ